MAKIGSLSLDLIANTGRFQNDLGKAARASNTFERKLKRSMKNADRHFKSGTAAVAQLSAAVLALAGVAGMGALIKSQSDVADAAAKAADKIGIEQEALMGLHHAAEQNGGSINMMNEALTKATKRLGEFNATGGGAAATWLEKLNLDTEKLGALQPDQLFNEYAEAIGSLNSRGEQLAAISALMGDESRNLINVIEQGPDALKAYADEADVLGISISRIDAAQIESMNDSMDRASKVVKGVGTTLSVKLAPLFTMVTKRFSGLAVAHNGFKDAIDAGVRGMVRGVGWLADAWLGVKCVFGAVKLAAFAMIEGLSSGIAWIDKGLSSFVSKFKVFGEIKPNAALQSWAVSAKLATDEAAVSLRNLFESPLPSDGIKQAFDEIVESSRATAEAVVADKKRMFGGGAVGDNNTDGKDKGDDTADQEYARYLDRLQSKNEALRQSFLTEAEIEAERYEEKQFIIEESFQAELLTAAERNAQLEDLEKQHQDKLTQINHKALTDRQRYEAMSAKHKTKTVLGELASLTSGIARHSKAAFLINKTASMANAIMSGYEGVNKAIATYSPPLSFAMAALQGAAAAANVSNIASTSFGGGGSVSPAVGSSGGTSAVSAGAIAAPETAAVPELNARTFSITDIDENAVMSGQAVRNLIDLIKEQQEDGYVLT
ncbi:MAG: hypothetical protein M3H12_20850 [Chromatiales bacterium]|nr:hypothetical protein [Gammaproteobacteria bacterium]